MMNRIIDFSDKNRFLIFLFVAVAIVLGWNSMRNTKLDAIPDLSDTQVIVYAKWDRSPDIMEDQVSYPIASALLGLPKVKDIRAFSDFGFSYIYIIFDEGTDIYWARSRTLEYLNSVTSRLPKGVSVELAKDVTSVGWVYQYALVDTTGKYSIEQLRSYQDWYLRYALQTVPGVAEVAPIGGFVRQYQVNVDPNKLLAYKIPINAVSDAVQKSNNDVGGRLVEFTGREYMVRGRGYMPSTLPGISVTEAERVLETQDKIIRAFPEVERVFGKAGRAESSTDPAPYSMMETTIVLKPQDRWPKVDRWYSKTMPPRMQPILRRFWPDHISTQELTYGPGGLNEALQIPGISNAWTMPIKARTDMLNTGIRTPLGIKVLGSDLAQIQQVPERSASTTPDTFGEQNTSLRRVRPYTDSLRYLLWTPYSMPRNRTCGLQRGRERSPKPATNRTSMFRRFHRELACCLSKPVPRLPRRPTECGSRGRDPNPREHCGHHAETSQPRPCFLMNMLWARTNTHRISHRAVNARNLHRCP
jgi:Cu/Ag efflux pump CusA